MGRATASKLAREGTRIAVVDLNDEAVSAVAKELNGLSVACDVADGPTSEAQFRHIVAQLGRPHVLVNCAGIAPGARIVGRDGPGSLEEFERVVRVNLSGTFNWMRLAAHAMKDTDPDEDGQRGVIVNTASVAAYEGQIGQAAYAASKGGVASPAARACSLRNSRYRYCSGAVRHTHGGGNDLGDSEQGD